MRVDQFFRLLEMSLHACRSGGSQCYTCELQSVGRTERGSLSCMPQARAFTTMTTRPRAPISEWAPCPCTNVLWYVGMRGPVHQRGGRARSTVTEPCMLQVQRSVAPTSDTDTEIELLCKERT